MKREHVRNFFMVHKEDIEVYLRNQPLSNRVLECPRYNGDGVHTVTEEDRKKYNIRKGIAGGLPIQGKQVFRMRLWDIVLTTNCTGIPKKLLVYEDPRDCSDALGYITQRFEAFLSGKDVSSNE